jgi:molecular chaperone GrpE
MAKEFNAAHCEDESLVAENACPVAEADEQSVAGVGAELSADDCCEASGDSDEASGGGTFNSIAIPRELCGEFEHFVEKQAESENYRESMLRALADLENYKKRAQRERTEIRNNTIGEFMETLLPVLDNFEFGLAAAEQHGESKILDGFKMIFTNFKNLLSNYGLCEIYPLNEQFDVNFHECVRRVSGDETENDRVVAVDRKGYVLNGRLLRPAFVAVSKCDERR